VLIGKVVHGTSIGKVNQHKVCRDRSTIVKGNEPAVVENIMRYQNKDGRSGVVVKTRACRRPQVGDKVSSLHGQKGVLGLVMPQEDMPFAVRDGMSPGESQ